MPDYTPDAATARVDLCRFLSACYYEPGVEFAEERLFDSMLAAASVLHPDLAEPARRLGAAFAADDLRTLLVDYTRLFLGPLEAHAKPYESSWLTPPVSPEDNPPPAVLERYAEGGMEIDAEFMELPDHIAVELEFLYLLNFNAHQASLGGDAEAAASIASQKQRFLDEHLGAWVAPFAAAVARHAQTAFYRELAALTERCVRMEQGVAAPH
ncbi:MAG: molecular chaperone TorD family protein [Burkholderiales bacterium]|nr:molecular chaperone TorD family protein [Burkholderiales bacterium]